MCFPGRMLLELLIFGNVAVLSESKHATRFRGQPQTFFLLSFQAGFSLMLLCSLRLSITEATRQQVWGSQLCHCMAKICLRQWGGRPLKHHPLGLPKHQELASCHESMLCSHPQGLGKRFQKAKALLSTFTSIYLGDKPSRAEKDIYISLLSPATTETLWFRRRPVALLMKCLQ